MTYIYNTYFELTNPVTDYEAARDYLAEDEMVLYFHESAPEEIARKVEKIDWILCDEQCGRIEVMTNEELNPNERIFISKWIKGQNSDGLGEGFEQQSWAEYTDVIDEYGEPSIYDEDWVRASFDWEYNDYNLTLAYKQGSRS